MEETKVGVSAERKTGYYWIVYKRRKWIFYYNKDKEEWYDVLNYKRYYDYDFDKIYETQLLAPANEPSENYKW